MNQLIHFRSHIEGHHPSESRNQKTRGPWTEVHSIRPYVAGDDPRNIAWKKWAGSWGLYSKERELSEHAPVILISLLDRQYSDFHTQYYPVSKQDFLSTLERSLAESALHLRFPLEVIDPHTDVIAHRESNSCIILLLWDIENRKNTPEFLHLARDNDVIFLSLSHPIELDPFEEVYWFESKIIKQEYRNALEKEKKALEKILHDRWIAIIPCTTDEHPVELLNHFFKYRYAR